MATHLPDEAVLRRFLLGDLSPAELEAVGRHLDAHPHLLSTLNALKADDTLLSALRAGDAADPPELAAVVARAAGLATVTAGEPTADPDPADLSALLARLGPPARPGDLGRLGGYHVVRLLGRGGMGAVFEAEDPRLGRRVALKVALPTLADRRAAADRFAREVRATAAVEHDHIVPVYGTGVDGGLAFLAMPLLAGRTLADRLADGRPVPVAELLQIGRQVADGLAAAHAVGLVHRDVKPSNVWLEARPDGGFKRVRVLDFGLAKPAAGGDDLTRPGAVVGTPAYMAPEQARGQPADARADLFSLGAVLYQMATGDRPFPGADPMAVLAAVLADTPPPAVGRNPAVPPALSALIDRLLSKDPADRPTTAAAVAAELGRIAADVRAADETAAWPAPKPAKPRRRRWVAAGLLGVAAAAVAVGVVVVKVKTPDGKEVVRLKVPEGSQVEIGPDGEATVTVPKGKTVAVGPPAGENPPAKAAVAWPPAGDRPPPADAVADGEVVYADPFDGPELNRLPTGNDGRTHARFEGGVYVCEFPPHDRPAATQSDFGPNPQDVAFAARVRTTDAMFGLRFRQLAGPDRKSCLAFLVTRDGMWELQRTNVRRDGDGGWVFAPAGRLRVAAAPDPELASGRWFTLAVRSSGPHTTVWVNGRLLTEATELTPPPVGLAPADKGFSAGVNFLTPGRCGFELDYLTVWRLPLAWPPVGEKPPARDAVPGELVFYDTFDDPKSVRLPIGPAGPDRFAVADGRYVMARPAAAPGNTVLYQNIGPEVRAGMAAIRLRVEDGSGFVTFGNRNDGRKARWLSFNLTADGDWQVSAASQDWGNGSWGVPRTVGTPAIGSGPDPSRAVGVWVNVVARWTDTEYELWVNGRRAAGGALGPVDEVKALGQAPALQIGVQTGEAGPARVEVEYAAVWRQPSPPPAE